MTSTTRSELLLGFALSVTASVIATVVGVVISLFFGFTAATDPTNAGDAVFAGQVLSACCPVVLHGGVLGFGAVRRKAAYFGGWALGLLAGLILGACAASAYLLASAGG
jgi:type III secretory pathway component EscS